MAKDDTLANVKEHKIAAKVLKKIGKGTAVTHLVGYLADSGNTDVIRLYLNLDFDKYVEIRKSDILHSEDAPPDVIDLGGTYLWIRKDAECRYVEVQSSTIKADFLSGDISSTFLRPGAIGPPRRLPGVGYAYWTRSWECNTVSWPCPPAVYAYWTRSWECNTVSWPCPPLAH